MPRLSRCLSAYVCSTFSLPSLCAGASLVRFTLVSGFPGIWFSLVDATLAPLRSHQNDCCPLNPMVFSSESSFWSTKATCKTFRPASLSQVMRIRCLKLVDWGSLLIATFHQDLEAKRTQRPSASPSRARDAAEVLNSHLRDFWSLSHVAEIIVPSTVHGGRPRCVHL